MFSVYNLSCLSHGSGRWCSNTVEAWAVESCEVCNDRQTHTYFSEQEALKWAAVLHICPNWSRQLSVAWRGEKERRGNMAHSFQTVSLCLPWLWVCHSISQWKPLFVWGRKRGYFVSIISGSLVFETVGVQNFLWLEAGLFSVPSLCLSTGICPLCPLCRPLNALICCMLTPVEFSNKASTFWIISVVGIVRLELLFSASLANAECGLTSNLCGLRAYQSRSFTSFCLSANKNLLSVAVPLFPPVVLWWHFTSLACTNFSLIQLRANNSWIDVMLKWALNDWLQGTGSPADW